MENVTIGGWTDHTQFIEYQVSVVMWKVVPPFILVLGTFGNLATILVMRRIKDNNSSQYVILMALAVADMCMLYFALLPAWLQNVFSVFVQNMHTVLCRIYFWAVYASGTTTAWLVTTVTVQRTMAVLWPHRMRVLCTVRRTWIVIAVVVVTAWSSHLHMTVGFHIIDNEYCSVSGEYKLFMDLVWQSMDLCISSLVPSSFLFVCSVLLSWTLFKSTSISSTAVRATSHVSSGQPHEERKGDAVKVTVMVLALSGTFLILTLPVCVFWLWRENADVSTPRAESLAAFFESLTSLMWYTNSAVNFLLYCITGARFRKEFLSLLHCGPRVHTVK